MMEAASKSLPWEAVNQVAAAFLFYHGLLQKINGDFQGDKFALLHDCVALLSSFTATGNLSTKQITCREVDHTLIPLLQARSQISMKGFKASGKACALYFNLFSLRRARIEKMCI